MQYTMRSVLISEYDPEAAARVLTEAGELAGSEFCKAVLDLNLGFHESIADLHVKLKNRDTQG